MTQTESFAFITSYHVFKMHNYSFQQVNITIFSLKICDRSIRVSQRLKHVAQKTEGSWPTECITSPIW